MSQSLDVWPARCTLDRRRALRRIKDEQRRHEHLLRRRADRRERVGVAPAAVAADGKPVRCQLLTTYLDDDVRVSRTLPDEHFFVFVRAGRDGDEQDVFEAADGTLL